MRLGYRRRLLQLLVQTGHYLSDLRQAWIDTALRLPVENHIPIQKNLKPPVINGGERDTYISLELGPDLSGDPRRRWEVASAYAVPNLHI